MTRMLIRIALFLMTLLLGSSAARLANHILDRSYIPTEIEVLGANEQKFAEFPRGVRILYDGLFPTRPDQQGPVLRFHIYNGSAEDLTCIGYSGMCASPEIQLRGNNIGSWECMNGSSYYTVKPGESAELMVDPQDFNVLPNSSEFVTIGYKFEYQEGRSDQYFAGPIVLPADFRKAVSKHLKELRDLEAGIYR